MSYEKTCNLCRVAKPFNAFAKASGTKDGLQAKCKPCNAAIVMAWRKANPERFVNHVRKWQKANPEKFAAQRALNLAVANGRVLKGACEVCGSMQTEAHHSDYSKPLEVTWLCKTHHEQAHHELTV